MQSMEYQQMFLSTIRQKPASTYVPAGFYSFTLLRVIDSVENYAVVSAAFASLAALCIRMITVVDCARVAVPLGWNVPSG